MGRGGAIYWSYTALVLLSAITPASAGLWDVSIDLGPAPSPEDGPPLSYNAVRNSAVLPYEVIGIVAAYFGVILFVGTLFLAVGKRLRKQTLEMDNMSTEMSKPSGGIYDRSPVSPRRMRDTLRMKKSMSSSLRSSGNGQDKPIVDVSVVQSDRMKAQEQMASLYDALWEEENRKSRSRVTTAELPKSHHGAPTYSVDRSQLQQDHPSPSYHALYPDEGVVNVNRPIYEHPIRSPVTASDPSRGRATSFGKSRAADIISGATQGRQPLRKSIKNLKISAPLQKLRNDDNHDDARTPLSPQCFVNPGHAPEPPSARTLDSQGYPVTPGSTITADFAGAYGEDLDTVREMPLANPQRISPAGSEPRRGGTMANINTKLPFREMYGRRPPQQPNMPPMSPGYLAPQSAGPVKTTFVDAPRNHLGAPLTGMPTPYSPYFVGALVTPVTPRIMSREERKQKKKEDRAGRGVITEEDQVADDKDLWASGY